MQEEVQENKRFKVSDRRLSEDTVFTPSRLQPTVGAGGQYRVNVQQQPKNSFEKLAESLQGFNNVLNAKIENREANEQYAAQKITDSTLEEAKELKANEKELYKNNSFFDKLTRLGKIPADANPLAYSRGQRAYGAKVAKEKYSVEMAKAIKESHKSLRSGGDAESISEIQKRVAQNLTEEFGITGSAEIGFNEIISPINVSSAARDVEVRDRIATVNGIASKAEDNATILENFDPANPTSTISALKASDGMHNNLNPTNQTQALRVAVMQQLDTNPKKLGAFLNSLEKGELDGATFAGIDISNPIYHSIFKAAEDGLLKAEEEDKRNSITSRSIKASNITKLLSNSDSKILNSETFTLRDVGAEEVLKNLTDEQLDQVIDPTIGNPMGQIYESVYGNFGSNDLDAQNIVNRFSQNRDTSNANRNAANSNVEKQLLVNSLGIEMVKYNDRDNVDPLQQSLFDGVITPSQQSDLFDEREAKIEELGYILRTGKTQEGEVVEIGGVSFASAPQEERDAYVRSVYKKDNLELKQSLARLKQEKENRDAKIAEEEDKDRSDDVKSSYNELYDSETERSFSNDRDKKDYTNLTWTLAKAKDGDFDAKMENQKNLVSPKNRGNVVRSILNVYNSKNTSRGSSIYSPYGTGEVGRVGYDVDEFKNKSLAFESLQIAGVTYSQIMSLSDGGFNMEGTIIKSDYAHLSKIPIINEDGSNLTEDQLDNIDRVMRKSFPDDRIDRDVLIQLNQRRQSIINYDGN
jgi:hypothetical protein